MITNTDVLLMKPHAEYAAGYVGKSDMVENCINNSKFSLSDPEQAILRMAIAVVGDPKAYHATVRQMIPVSRALSSSAKDMIYVTLADVVQGDLSGLPLNIAEKVSECAFPQGLAINQQAHSYIM